MRNTTMGVFVLSAVLLAASSTAMAIGAWGGTPLGMSNFRDVWSGPKLYEEDLRGKVVLVIFWIYDNKASLNELSRLGSLGRRFRRKGLMVACAHVGKGDDVKRKALDVIGSRNVKCTVVPSGNISTHISLKELGISRLPSAIIYAHGGAVCYKGYPGTKMMAALTKALKARPIHPVLAGPAYKKLRIAVAKIKKGQLGAAWRDCNRWKSSRRDKGEEARRLLDKLEEWAAIMDEWADNNRERSPTKTVEILNRLARRYKGTEFADNAAKKLKALKMDEQFQKELKAEKACAMILKMAEKMPPRPTGGKERKKWDQRYGRSFDTLQGKLEKMAKDFPGTKALKQAEQAVKKISEGQVDIDDLGAD